MRISDWSSDVCSSDLQILRPEGSGQQFAEPIAFHRAAIARGAMDEDVGLRPLGRLVQYLAAALARGDGPIGRASCRDRVCQYGLISGVALSLKKKTRKEQ